MADAIDSKPVPETEAETHNPATIPGSKVAMRDVYANLVGAMGDRWRMSKYFPEFPHKIHAHRPDPNSGVRHILIDDGNEVMRQIDDLELASMLMKWTRAKRIDMGCDKYQIPHKVALALVEEWKSLQKKLIDPVDMLWRDEPGPTYHRLPWTRDEVRGQPTKLWDDIMERMGPSHALTFKCFVGSLYHPKADVQQYLYLYGSGGDGKGAIIRMLEKTLGKAFKSEMIPADGDKFWTHGLLNRRLIAFPDADPKAMLKSGKIKSLLGGDSQRIEPKKKASYSVRLRLKMLISSNTRPNISSSPADMRRCLFIPLPPLPPGTKVDPSYEENLWAETGAFLLKCMDVYSVMCPKHEPIKYDTGDLAEHVASLEERFEVFADANFEFYPEEMEKLPRDRSYVLPSVMDGRVRAEFRTMKEQEEFRAWLEHTHKVKSTAVKTEDGKTQRRYIGLSYKEGGGIEQAKNPPKW